MFKDEKELVMLFVNCFKEMTWVEKLKVVGTVIGAAVLVLGGIYLVAFAGYISGT